MKKDLLDKIGRFRSPGDNRGANDGGAREAAIKRDLYAALETRIAKLDITLSSLQADQAMLEWELQRFTRLKEGLGLLIGTARTKSEPADALEQEMGPCSVSFQQLFLSILEECVEQGLLDSGKPPIRG
jgi:hypothetical protein